MEVTEAGRVQGLVRPRGTVGVQPYQDDRYRTMRFREYPENYSRGDEVNTLVLVNTPDKPLLLLAGEIVTGGKQDRVIAKDRIVPAGGDPIDLSVFCIEPGRWTESSATFGAAGKEPAHSFMVQPTVRERGHGGEGPAAGVGFGARSHLAPWRWRLRLRVRHAWLDEQRKPGDVAYPRALGTTSYAKVMQDSAVSEKVDEAAAPVMKSREQVLAQLREEHAVGVVVAVRGEIVWADLFADTELLSRYWTKLVRSYAAESLTEGDSARRALGGRCAAFSRCALGRHGNQRRRCGSLPLSRTQVRRHGDLCAGIAAAGNRLRRAHQQNEAERCGVSHPASAASPSANLPVRWSGVAAGQVNWRRCKTAVAFQGPRLDHLSGARHAGNDDQGDRKKKDRSGDEAEVAVTQIFQYQLGGTNARVA